MRVAALFAATYGFPPSACADKEEAIGLLRNIPLALAIKSVSVANGAGAVMSPDAAADLMIAAGASPKDVMSLRFSAMRQQAGGR